MTQKNKHAGQADREIRMSLARCFTALLAASVIVSCPALAATESPNASEYVKPLGDQKYQVGKIVVDRKAGRFVLPARVHVLDKPLEYLLTSVGGMKEYETLLESDVTGTEFNLACILLGLEPPADLSALYQFSETPLDGMRVHISIAWQRAGKKQVVSAEEALIEPENLGKEIVEWVYVGSNIGTGGQFSADMTGTLVGFVHDNNSVIDTRYGLGIGAYGSIDGNSDLLPPVGSDVELIVQRTAPTDPDEGGGRP